jgi:predicted RNase H-like nuclease (RuvC/YqgF family)
LEKKVCQGEGLQASITQLLKEQEKARQVIAEAEQAKKALARIKAEAKTEELKSSTLVACLSKNSATKTATTALNGLNSLLGGNKVNRLEKENAQVHREVEDLNDQIESLRTDMQKMKDNHARELNRTNEQHQQEVGNLKRILDKAYKWFPTFKQVLTLERECKEYGFNEEQTDKLVHAKPIQYNGWLHSNEYRRNALATNVAAQIVRDAKTLVLQINDTSISQWFRVQFGIGQEQHRELKL